MNVTTDDLASVLVVDDEPHGLEALKALLDPYCRVDTCRSGQEALLKLLANDYAVILLDVMMPIMDGFETAALIRERDRNRTTPIVFMTAWNKNDAEVLRGYALGAVDYVFKPIEPEILRGKVQVFLTLDAQRRALARQNAELEIARAEARQESEFKSRFLASVSHELRTPLQGIIGFSELMIKGAGGELAPRHQEFVGQVLSSGRHLLSLVDDLLDLARIESGHIDLRLRTVDLCEVAAEVIATMRPVAEDAGILIVSELPPPPLELTADPVRIKQVLYNLVSNAVKFTPNGGTAWVRAIPGEQDVVVEVEDTGSGIPPELAGRLFQDFARAADALGPRQFGTGLGLAVTRRLVEAHGGTIAVERASNGGARFRVSLPARVAPVVA